jgi:hypothetical protein
MEYQPLLPMLTLGIDSPDFDYSAFVQQDDDDDVELADVSSANGMTDSSSHTLTPPSATSSSSQSSRRPPQKQRLERRGHTKSRRGCFNCKRRRIKVGFGQSQPCEECL